MRHRIYGKHLGRDKDERTTLFKGLVKALFTHGTIQTSEAKAKAIKGLVDRVITLAKRNKTYKLGLTKEILLKLGNRTSGYTSLVRLGTRFGDQTMMVRMSLIGAEELKPATEAIGTRQQVVVPEKKITVKAPIKKSITKKKAVTRPSSGGKK